ncbi:formate dehydrogenase subunit gamma [Noviherbaspirillum aridicola]|uniref:Formate dehydrogenase subunit gamma n=1 Tax=Noviherbaspirillum aridicola TaxID=2849687 RepID=A0ABQ4Q4E3_9BURK|nr:formate dehydrogenase subunit gamma [Noviherbaspirillum aridicola]GIZ52058.1 formate dehydrogenase subunit gamma [Noviherbaspirillum aridicola]
MNKWITGLALSTMLAIGTAAAQEAKTPAAQPAQPAPTAALPAVESVDILKQNQAERNRTQPGNAAPVFRAIKEGGEHYSSLPYPEAGVLIQPKAQFPGQSYATTAGEAWRQYRNGPLTALGAGLLLAALFVVTLLYFVAGQIKNKEAPTGRLIERFTPAERFVHWTVAITFLALALTGVIILFGKHFLLPIIGHTLFGWLGYLSKNVHNFVGPLFTVSIIAFFVLYVKDNLPAKPDLNWLLRAGGLFGGKNAKEPSSYRFNAGEKIWFWGGLTLMGLIVSASGFVLDMIVPGMTYSRSNMQIANIVHVVGTMLMMAGSIGHIYLGSIGMEGAYDGMRHGYVDDTWAKEHHDLWYEQVQNGEVPRVRSKAPGQGSGDAPAPVKV